MCGIAGIWARGRVSEPLIRAMTRAMPHRGPDDEGIWTDAEAGIALGHRRLSIVDLSPAGHQPMYSHDGRFVIVLNGEIYNHAEIRHELDRVRPGESGDWRGHSDTETLLEAISHWGLSDALDRAVGMFAFALWERNERKLSLVRDRFGEKPLYYGWAGGDLVFASELKAIREHQQFDASLDLRALRLFTRRTYIPAPLSIYQGIFKLEPGCILELDAKGVRSPLVEPPTVGSSGSGLRYTRYWSYRDVLQSGLAEPIAHEAEAVSELERVLAAAVRGQSMADVPVGAFLSGGIDSSTIVGLSQKYSSIPVRTFSVGFEQAGFNEAHDAKHVAEHLGTVHNEHYVTVQEARDVIPLLPSIYDEPFADSSQIPTYLVSRFAREQVTVALTGDGGDELFAGYNRHFAAPKLWQQLQGIPKHLRSAASRPLGWVPSQAWSALGGLIPGQRQPHFGSKVKKAFRIAAGADTFNDVYSSFLDEWSFEESPVLGAGQADNGFDLELGEAAPDTLRMMYCDAVSYLPDDILAKVDRASMAVSLETRVPFLDHRVAELAARIPLSLKVRDGKGKHILRQLLYGLVPQKRVDRPKAGFAVPVGEWIKGPLRPWAEDLLDRRRMAEEGWFDPEIVHRRWRAHLSGRRDSTPAIWAILMFQAWLHEQQSPAGAAA
jgi:asparagine synthase (glutamine-hydrolysing)